MINQLKKKMYALWLQLSQGIAQMLGANVLNRVIQMLSNMAITRLLTKSEYGMWSYVLNVYSYLNLLSGLGLLSGALQFGAENRNEKEEFQYYKYCLKVGLAIDTVLIILFIAGTCFVDMALEGAKGYVRLYAPILILEYLLNLLLTILRCENRIPQYAKILNINTVLTAVGTCVGALFGITGVIVGKYSAVLLSALQVLQKTKTEVKQVRQAKELEKVQIKPLWHYSLFVGASAAMNMLLYLLDVSMIAELIRDPADIANYKVATLIPTALGFIPNSVITAVLPNIILHHNDKKWLRGNIGKLFFCMAALNVCICAGLFLLAPSIIQLVSGVQYLPAVPIFRVLIIEYFFNGTFRMLSINILAGLHCVNYGLFLSGVSAICDICFNYYLIQNYAAIGAAYATLSVVLITSVLAFSYLQHQFLREVKTDA